jgi:putative ABC transport system permease protein
MLAPLDLKLLRDIGKMKGQMVAVSVVMACGLAMMIMSRSLILSLESTRDAYYEQHRFADVFCDVKRAPNALRPRLAQIEGVAAVDTRVTGSAKLDIPGLAEPADATVISLIVASISFPGSKPCATANASPMMISSAWPTSG